MIIPPENFMESRNPTDVLHTGIVIDNDDPLKLGRIRVFIDNVLEGEKDALPWCNPISPLSYGSSPELIDFSVPLVGSEVEIVFRGNLYTPVYYGSRLSESTFFKNIFSSDYPNISGSIRPSGYCKIHNNSNCSDEEYFSSGIFNRKSSLGDHSSYCKGDYVLDVGGSIKMRSGDVFTGGYGLGGILTDIGYAIINGPHMRGIIDLAAMLPESSVEVSEKTPIRNFYDNIFGLQMMLIRLYSDLLPDMSNLELILRTFPDRLLTINIFKKLGGIYGLLNIMKTSFGLYGSWFANFVDGSEKSLDNFIIYLFNPYSIRTEVFSLTENFIADTEEKWNNVRKVLGDMVSSITAIRQMSSMFLFCEGISRIIETESSYDLGTILSVLSLDMKKWFSTVVDKLLENTLETVDYLEEEDRIVFLSRFDLYGVMTTKFFSFDYMEAAINEVMFSFFIQSDDDDTIRKAKSFIRDYGDIVSFFIRIRLEFYDKNYENFKTMAGASTSTDSAIGSEQEFINSFYMKSIEKEVDDMRVALTYGFVTPLGKLVGRLVEIFPLSSVFPFIRNLDFSTPISEEKDSYGYFTYLSTDDVLRFIFMDLSNLDTPVEDKSLASDIINAGMGEMLSGETGGSGSIEIDLRDLMFAGKSIGSFCKALGYYDNSDLTEIYDINKEYSDIFISEEEDDEKTEKEKKEEIITGVRASLAYLFGSVYLMFDYTLDWFDDITEDLRKEIKYKKMDLFLNGLDVNSLTKSRVSVVNIMKTVSSLINIMGAKPYEFYPYGSNINYILSSGVSPSILFSNERINLILSEIMKIFYGVGIEEPETYDIVAEDEEDALSIRTGLMKNGTWNENITIKNLPWLNFPNGCSAPASYFLYRFFGSPGTDQRALYDSSRRKRYFEIISQRALRVGSLYRDANIRYYEKNQ